MTGVDGLGRGGARSRSSDRLDHACDPDGSGNLTHIMQSGRACDASGGNRNLGFATRAREDVGGKSVVEVDQLIQTARGYVWGWQLQ